VTKKMKNKMKYGGKLNSIETKIIKKSLKRRGIPVKDNPYHNQIKDFFIIMNEETHEEFLFFKLNGKQYVKENNSTFIFQLDLAINMLMHEEEMNNDNILEVLRIKRERRVQNQDFIEIPAEDHEFPDFYEEQQEWIEKNLSNQTKKIIEFLPMISIFNEKYEEEMALKELREEE